MAKEADPERQRRKRALRVVRGGRKARAGRRGAKKGRERDPRAVRRAVGGAATLIFLIAMVITWIELDPYGTDGESRMARFPGAPDHVLADLRYLSYLDSLARDGRAVPPEDDPADPTVAVTLARRAGLSDRRIRSWGLLPEADPEHGRLTTVFRELGRRQRIVLPYYDAALWIHLRERRVHPGYLIFGRTRRASPEEVDFCAVLTAINSVQPEYTALIWRDPDTGTLVHDSYEALPQFEYYGGGRLGDDLADVYRQYFQLRDQRDQKPLY